MILRELNYEKELKKFQNLCKNKYGIDLDRSLDLFHSIIDKYMIPGEGYTVSKLDELLSKKTFVNNSVKEAYLYRFFETKIIDLLRKETNKTRNTFLDIDDRVIQRTLYVEESTNSLPILIMEHLIDYVRVSRLGYYPVDSRAIFLAYAINIKNGKYKWGMSFEDIGKELDYSRLKVKKLLDNLNRCLFLKFFKFDIIKNNKVMKIKKGAERLAYLLGRLESNYSVHSGLLMQEYAKVTGKPLMKFEYKKDFVKKLIEEAKPFIYEGLEISISELISNDSVLLTNLVDEISTPVQLEDEHVEKIVIQEPEIKEKKKKRVKKNEKKDSVETTKE